MERIYDVIIWGASGFTGRLVVDYIEQRQKQSNLTWAVAGRSESKIKQILDGRDVPLLLADSHDKKSLIELVKKTKVILTTVGPYARYGSELVEACAENGTHYCDLTGEVNWMRQMIYQYNYHLSLIYPYTLFYRDDLDPNQTNRYQDHLLEEPIYHQVLQQFYKQQY